MADDKKIRIASNIPGLKDKIISHIQDGKDTIYWYIQFNVPLDKNTVSHKTMSITDTSGYIMRTDISYMEGKHIIVISPLDSYEENVYYLLNITKKVKAESGRKMKTKIYILFKLMNNQISEYKILKSNVEVPKPKPRPKNYDQIRSRVYSFDQTPFVEAGKDKLPPMKMSVNVVAGVLGIIIMGCYFFFLDPIFLFGGFVVCLLGIAHIIYQIRQKKFRSLMAYNKGVRYFNKEKYPLAEACFKKAQGLDQNNEEAEYALNKVGYFK